MKTAIIAPAAGPGVFWNLLVPVPMKTDAEKILKELPIDLTTEPDFWHFGGKPYAKKAWRIYAAIILILIVCAMLLPFVK